VEPRPFPEYHPDRFHQEFRRLRAKVAPALTVLWRVSARTNDDLKGGARKLFVAFAFSR
jgi:hypothetical protein